jgi:hypothetical protein
MFIELHMHSDNKPLLIGTHHICSVVAADRGGGTHIHLGDPHAHHVHVSETYNVIRDRLVTPQVSKLAVSG